MVKALFKRDLSSIVSVELKGHANYAVDDGFDMLCSAISAISLTIANGITEVVKVNPIISENDGFLSIDLQNLSSEDKSKCQVLLETMLLSLMNLEKSYGTYIKVKVEEV